MKTRYLVSVFAASIVFGGFAYADYQMDSSQIVNQMPKAMPNTKVPAYQLAAAEQQQEYPLNYQLPTPAAEVNATQEQDNLFSGPTTPPATQPTTTATTQEQTTQTQTTQQQVDETYIPNTEQQEVALPDKDQADVSPTTTRLMNASNPTYYSSGNQHSTQSYTPQSFSSTPVPIYFNNTPPPVETQNPVPAAPASAPAETATTQSAPAQSAATQ